MARITQIYSSITQGHFADVTCFLHFRFLTTIFPLSYFGAQLEGFGLTRKDQRGRTWIKPGFEV